VYIYIPGHPVHDVDLMDYPRLTIVGEYLGACQERGIDIFNIMQPSEPFSALKLNPRITQSNLSQPNPNRPSLT